MRSRFLAAAVAVAVAATVVTAAAFARHAGATTLVRTVGPGYTIKLQENGTNVSRLKAAKYTLAIHDRSAIHAWSLDGPNGFARDFTKVRFVGMTVVRVDLKPGKYKFYCPPHEATMFGHFTVTS